MKLIYEGIDITNDVDIIKAVINDNAGGIADNIELVFADPENLWREWNPQKGEELELQNEGFSSGIMFVDELWIKAGEFIIRAISLPLKAKTPKTKSWENIRFKSLARDLVGDIGLELKTYGITDYTYDRIDQVEKNNIEFLNERCRLEGYGFKITDGKAVIFDERTLEKTDPVTTITTSDILIGEFEFQSISSGLYSACSISHLSKANELIEFNFTPSSAPIGPILRSRVRASSQGEAERFAKGLLRAANKHETIGYGTVPLTPNIAAGNTIKAVGIGPFSGIYFLENISHNLTGGKTFFNIRKVKLEGY